MFSTRVLKGICQSLLLQNSNDFKRFFTNLFYSQVGEWWLVVGDKFQKCDMIGEKSVGFLTHQVANVVTSYQQIPLSSSVVIKVNKLY